jgi:hypothetical protein
MNVFDYSKRLMVLEAVTASGPSEDSTDKEMSFDVKLKTYYLK